MGLEFDMAIPLVCNYYTPFYSCCTVYQKSKAYCAVSHNYRKYFMRVSYRGARPPPPPPNKNRKQKSCSSLLPSTILYKYNWLHISKS